MYRLMLVDDEANILSALKRVLRGQGWELETYVSANEALRRAQTATFELFLSDFRMPEMDGVAFLSQVKQIQPESMRIILSGYADYDALLASINQASIFRFIAKPWKDWELIETLNQALAHHDILVENRRLADQVRDQQQQLQRRDEVLGNLKQMHPALAEVNWGEDGSIILTEEDV